MKFTSSSGRTSHMHVQTSEFAAIKQWLREYADHHFPVGSVVVVVNPRFRGSGIVVSYENCPADHLAVLVESGNYWFYHLDTIVVRETRPNRWPNWIRVYKINQKKAELAKRARSEVKHYG